MPSRIIVGTTLWNTTIYSEFVTLMTGCTIKANLRPELEGKCARVLNMLLAWSKETSMRFSTEKTDGTAQRESTEYINTSKEGRHNNRDRRRINI